MFGFWLLIAAICNLLALVAAAAGASAGAHGGGVQLGVCAFIMFILSIPLLSIAALLAASKGCRAITAGWFLNFSGVGFLASMVLLLAISLPLTEVYFSGSPLIPVAVKQVNSLVRANFALISQVAGAVIAVAWLTLVVAVSAFFVRHRRAAV